MQHWTAAIEEPKPVRTHVIDDGAIRLVVEEKPTGEKWQHCLLSFGRISKHQTYDTCLERWPREAIAIARATLAAFELKLDGEVD